MAVAIHVAARAVLVAVGAGAVVATMFAAAPAASADLPPNCTAGDLAQVATGVSAAMSVYLHTHPDVNAFFTDLQGLPPETVRARIADYGAANPQVQAELQGIRQPMIDMRARCGGGFSGDES
jgi:hemophore-related protein